MVTILRYKDNANRQTEDTSQNDLKELKTLLGNEEGVESSVPPTGDIDTHNIEYSVTETNEDIVIHVNFKYRNEWHKKDFSYNKEESKGKFLQVDAGRFTYGFSFIQYNVLDILDNMFFKSRTQHPHETIFRVLFEPDGNILIALLKPYHAIEGFNNIEMDNNKTVLGAFVDNSPWFAERYALIRKKAELLNLTDVYKSVSYLEAQVDVLTRALLSLLPNNSSLYETLQKADEYSVLNMKPLSDIQKEFTESKANFRALQEEYFTKLYETENNSNSSGE